MKAQLRLAITDSNGDTKYYDVGLPLEQVEHHLDSELRKLAFIIGKVYGELLIDFKKRGLNADSGRN